MKWLEIIIPNAVTLILIVNEWHLYNVAKWVKGHDWSERSLELIKKHGTYNSMYPHLHVVRLIILIICLIVYNIILWS